MSGGFGSLRDDVIMRSMLTKVGDIPETVLLPMLRLVSDDRQAVDAGWQAVTAGPGRGRLLESPRKSWERRYGQFVRELEWALPGLSCTLRVRPANSASTHQPQ